MHELEQLIDSAISDAKPYFNAIIERAWVAYQNQFPKDTLPTAADIERADRQAEKVLMNFLLDEWGERTPLAKLSEQQRTLLSLKINQLIAPLQTPTTLSAHLNYKQLAVLSATGTLVGMIVGGIITWLLINHGASGVLLGGIIGAYLSTLFNARLKDWPALHWLSYFRKQQDYDISNLQNNFKVIATSWLNQAIALATLLQLMLQKQLQLNPEQEDRRRALGDLGNYLIRLHQANKNDLAIIAQELLEAAEHQGFENLSGAPQFAKDTPTATATLIWNNDLADRYKCFGYIKPGMPVKVIKMPVIRKGEILERGVVRKINRASNE